MWQCALTSTRLARLRGGGGRGVQGGAVGEIWWTVVAELAGGGSAGETETTVMLTT
jgi:hypothetical protein